MIHFQKLVSSAAISYYHKKHHLNSMNMKNKLLSVLEGTLSQTCRGFLRWTLTKAFCSAAPWIRSPLVSASELYWNNERWKYFSLSLDDWLEIVRNVSHLLSSSFGWRARSLQAASVQNVSAQIGSQTHCCLLMVMWGTTANNNWKIHNVK